MGAPPRQLETPAEEGGRAVQPQQEEAADSGMIWCVLFNSCIFVSTGYSGVSSC